MKTLSLPLSISFATVTLLGTLAACGGSSGDPTVDEHELLTSEEQALKLKIGECIKAAKADAGADIGSPEFVAAVQKCAENVAQQVKDALADAGIGQGNVGNGGGKPVLADGGIAVPGLDGGLPIPAGNGSPFGDGGVSTQLPDGGTGVCPKLFACPPSGCRCLVGDNKGKECTNPGTCQTLCEVCFP